MALLCGLPLGNTALGVTPWWRVERASAHAPLPATPRAMPGNVATKPGNVATKPVEPFRWGYFGAHEFAAPASWHRGFTGEVSTWRVHR